MSVTENSEVTKQALPDVVKTNNKGLVSVKFEARYKMYNKDDIAGFSPTEAKKIVNGGKGNYWEPPKEPGADVTVDRSTGMRRNK